MFSPTYWKSEYSFAWSERSYFNDLQNPVGCFIPNRILQYLWNRNCPVKTGTSRFPILVRRVWVGSFSIRVWMEHMDFFFYFAQWSVQAEGYERATCTEVAIADWRTKQNKYPAVTASHTEKTRTSAVLGFVSGQILQMTYGRLRGHHPPARRGCAATGKYSN
jgi:hypothetical protein